MTEKKEVKKTVKKKAATSAETCKVRLDKSPNKRGKAQVATVKGLGLRRIGHEVTVEVTPSTQGMISAVRHLVTVTTQ